MADQNKDWMDEETINWIKTSETPIDHLYQDTTGNVTVGYGHMVKNAEAAKSIPFRYETMDGRYATARETEEAFKKVQAAQNSKENNYSARYYDPEMSSGFDKLYLDDEQKDLLFKQDIGSAIRDVEETDEFKNAPPSAKQAAADMFYNMGADRFSEHIYDHKEQGLKPGWPKLYNAAKREDWKAVGDESHRKDVSPERNSETKRRFYRAEDESEME